MKVCTYLRAYLIREMLFRGARNCLHVAYLQMVSVLVPVIAGMHDIFVRVLPVYATIGGLVVYMVLEQGLGPGVQMVRTMFRVVFIVQVSLVYGRWRRTG